MARIWYRARRLHWIVTTDALRLKATKKTGSGQYFIRPATCLFPAAMTKPTKNLKNSRIGKDLFKHRKPGPLGQVRGNWLCRIQMPWGDGILECWNNGLKRRRSFFDTPGKPEINPAAADRFLYPVFHYSTIPSFHSTTNGKLHPCGVDQSRALWTRIFTLLLIEREVLLGVYSWTARSAFECWSHPDDFSADSNYSTRSDRLIFSRKTSNITKDVLKREEISWT